MYGVSYDGLTTAMTLLHPHPALKAISEQASPVDQWMNDDMHRYGALRESYAFEYAVMEQADKNENTHFDFDTYDTYRVVSRRRSAREHQRQISARQDSVLERHRRASRLRRLLEEGGLGHSAPRFHRSQSQRRGILGSGRSLGAVADLPPRRASTIPITPTSSSPVRGSTANGRLPRATASALIRFGGSRNRARVSREYRGALLPLLPARRGREARLASHTFQTGSTPGTPTPRGRPKRPSRPNSIFTPTARSRSTRRQRQKTGKHFREYVSDPANPVPYRAAPDLADVSRPATGGPGKSPTSASSIIARTF